MIKILLMHVIYEQCINALFRSVSSNFSKPIFEKSVLGGRTIAGIETFVETNGAILKIVYSEVKILETDEIGMLVYAVYGTMQEYPIYEGGKVYANSNFQDYIKYEDIIQIFE